MISVVIPCYNAEEDIGDAIRSVLRQSRDDLVRDIIVVDDGSTDGSREVVERLAGADDRIQYVYQENAGPSVARNKGVECSTQDYVAFLDADDLWLEDKLEKQASFLLKRPAVGLLCGDYFLRGQKGEERRVKANHFDWGWEDNLERLFVNGGPILMSTVVMKTEYFRDIGGFDPALPKAQDTDLWLRIAAEYAIHHIPEPLVLKRERGGSVGANGEIKARYLHQITEEIIERYPRLKQLRRKRDALIENYLGTYHLRDGSRQEAIGSFARALRANKFNVKSYVLLLIACAPIRAKNMGVFLDALGRVKVKMNSLLA